MPDIDRGWHGDSETCTGTISFGTQEFSLDVHASSQSAVTGLEPQDGLLDLPAASRAQEFPVDWLGAIDVGCQAG